MEITKEIIDISKLQPHEKEKLAEALWKVAKDYIIGWNYMQFKSHYVFCNLHHQITQTPVNKVLVYKHKNIISSFVFLQYLKFVDNPLYISRLYAIVDGRDRGHLSTISMAVKEWLKFYFRHPLQKVFFVDTVYHPVLYSQIKKLVPRVYEGPEVITHHELQLLIETYCYMEGIKTNDNYDTVHQGDFVRYKEEDLEDFKRLKNEHFETFFKKTAGKNGGLLIAFPVGLNLALYGVPRYLNIMMRKLPRQILRSIIHSFKRKQDY